MPGKRPPGPGTEWTSTPRPDPTLLTTGAVDRAAGEFRRELAALRELLEARIAHSDTQREDLRVLLDERHAAQLRAFETARATALASVQAALEATREAISKADNATEKRFDAINEFRRTLADQNATFLTRAQYEPAHESLVQRTNINGDRIAAIELRLTSRLDLAAGRDSGEADTQASQRLSQNAVVSLVVAVIIAASLVISVLTFLHR